MIGHPEAGSSTASGEKEEKDSFPKERGVGHMGRDQNWLPQSIILTEADEMQVQGIITQYS